MELQHELLQRELGAVDCCTVSLDCTETNPPSTLLSSVPSSFLLSTSPSPPSLPAASPTLFVHARVLLGTLGPSSAWSALREKVEQTLSQLR